MYFGSISEKLNRNSEMQNYWCVSSKNEEKCIGKLLSVAPELERHCPKKKKTSLFIILKINRSKTNLTVLCLWIFLVGFLFLCFFFLYTLVKRKQLLKAFCMTNIFLLYESIVQWKPCSAFSLKEFMPFWKQSQSLNIALSFKYNT